jgi:hypothetical protein
MEYSAQGNFGNPGYLASLSAELSESPIHYAAWWDYVDPNFELGRLSTALPLAKFGADPSHTIGVSGDGTGLFATALGGVGGATSEEQDANLATPQGGYFYARPLSWKADFALPLGTWFFVEFEAQVNTGPGVHDGWVELRIDGRRYYRAEQVDFYQSTGGPNFDALRLSGFYGFDSSGLVFYRRMTSVYVDRTSARVVVCEAAVLADCRHHELQIPIAWTNSEVRFVASRGSFARGSAAFVHVVDPTGGVHGPLQVTLE